MRSSDEVRAAETEALFREVNERIAESAQRFEADETEFVCECADASCTHRVSAPLDLYEEVRAEPTRFLLARGHHDERFEQVVVEREEVAVVEKMTRLMRETVQRLDPRTA